MRNIYYIYFLNKNFCICLCVYVINYFVNVIIFLLTFLGGGGPHPVVLGEAGYLLLTLCSGVTPQEYGLIHWGYPSVNALDREDELELCNTLCSSS